MISQCPQCGYSLAGLPEEHRCPECGLAYDAASEVYRHTNPKLLFGGLGGFFGGSFGMMRLVSVARSNASWAWLATLLVIFYFAAFAYAAYRLVLIYRRGPLVAVLPDGLYLRLRDDRGSLIAWADVERPVVPRMRKRITQRVRGRVMPTPIDGVFKTHADALRLSEQIEQRRQQCRDAPHDKEAGEP